MPTYVYFNNETSETEEHIHKISEMESFLETHPHLTRKISATLTVTGVNQKPDDGWRDVLKSIKKASGRNSTVNTF